MLGNFIGIDISYAIGRCRADDSMPDFIHFLAFIIESLHIDNHTRYIRFNQIWRSDAAVSAISITDRISPRIRHLFNGYLEIGRIQCEFASVNKLIWNSD